MRCLSPLPDIRNVDLAHLKLNSTVNAYDLFFVDKREYVCESSRPTSKSSKFSSKLHQQKDLRPSQSGSCLHCRSARPRYCRRVKECKTTHDFMRSSQSRHSKKNQS